MRFSLGWIGRSAFLVARRLLFQDECRRATASSSWVKNNHLFERKDCDGADEQGQDPVLSPRESAKRRLERGRVLT